ncbi:seryl-tRNA synthetase [Desulfonatronum thiosulfatophilum]|uniref:Serine--tRNA ligase n=1 Tax=Desulfonatronum thiosulfatophilum TaxID=617002 RepID=A0A1G6BDX4_9BACT|nr:serine--tRNA ligase [Desulfonatronum thiosulfatophilum]SDB18824.1 seryl-tRNA synthetase [Desulfonatronum thiosulfatophilum]
MLDAKFIRQSPERVRKALENRGADIDLDAFLTMEERHRALLQEVETGKARRNQASAEVAKRKRAKEDASALMDELSELSQRIKSLDGELKFLEQNVQDWLLNVPNLPHQTVPVGRSEADNPVLRSWGEPAAWDFAPLEHWELGTRLQGLDFERAAKITGARFALMTGWAARLERALINFMLDQHTRRHDYLEVLPPFIVNRDSLTGTGNLPKFADDLFKLEETDFFLIPTAEVPVTNIHRGEILAENVLPLAYAAYTPCFRSEAGAYGKDTKGLIRQHQFNKVELVRFTHPDASYDQLELLLGHAETILQLLELPYRVITLCTGDMGFSAAKTYDIEVWLPGQNAYREISSCSNFEDFQARRANIRFKPTAGGKNLFVHTLNGSGLAVGRTVVAILENYQQKDGSLVIPKALRPFMEGMEVVEPKG